MPRRMSPRDRLHLLERVIMRDGDICLLCRQMPCRDKTLDHVNGNKRDDRLENLALLCRACNTAEGNRARRGARLLTLESLPIYVARAAETVATRKGQNSLPDQSGARVTSVRVSESERSGVDRRGWGSTEETANLIMEPTYRLWLFRWVKERGFIGREDAIDAGAEYLDQAVGRASQQTIERYFRKVISSAGWLVEDRGESSEPVWVFRGEVDLSKLEGLLEGRMKAQRPQKDPAAPASREPAPEVLS